MIDDQGTEAAELAREIVSRRAAARSTAVPGLNI
jgi:hypothetical protein